MAIIGILTTIALIGLNSSKNRAVDSSIKRELTQVRYIAGMIYSDQGNYSLLCNGNSLNTTGSSLDYQDQLVALSDEISILNGGNDNVCATNGGDYCVQSVLTNSSQYWCVDSRGNVGSPMVPDTCFNTTACQ